MTAGETTAPRRLCSVVSRENGDDPAGTATPYDVYLIVEVPPPWNEDIAASVNYPAGLWDALLRAYDAGAVTRSTGILPDPEHSREGHTRVLLQTRPEEPFSLFDKTEYLLPDEELVGFVHALADGGEAVERYAARRQHTRDVRDILVCTHGANDACCGRFGYPVYNRLRWLARGSGELRVWRTSHIGGHRFAATLMDLPEGRCWGHLDVETAERVLYRDTDPAGLVAKYRGWAGLRTSFEQIAERDILSREGWKWTEYAKSAEVVKESEESARVRIGYASPDGNVSGVYEAEVKAAGSVMTLPKSGSEPLKEVPQYRVARLDLTE